MKNNISDLAPKRKSDFEWDETLKVKNNAYFLNCGAI